MTAPVVELLVALGTGERLGAVARRLASWADVRAHDAALAPPAARLASSWRAPRLAESLAEGAPPVAAWVAGIDEARSGSALLSRCSVLLCDRDEVATSLPAEVPGPSVVAVPRSDLDVDGIRPLTPYVRGRWRERLGLAPELVVDLRPASPAVSERVAPAALAVAAVLIVDRRWIGHALALGAAVVADRRTAEEAGAIEGSELVVAEGGAAVEVAGALAADVRRCAALGRAGRHLAERRWGLRAAALQLARQLDLLPEPLGPDQLLAERLAELGTPAGARVAARAREATALFAGTGVPT